MLAATRASWAQSWSPKAGYRLRADDEHGSGEASPDPQQPDRRQALGAGRKAGEKHDEDRARRAQDGRQPGLHAALGPGDQGEGHNAVQAGLDQELAPCRTVARQAGPRHRMSASRTRPARSVRAAISCQRRNGFDADPDEAVRAAPEGGEHEQKGEVDGPLDAAGRDRVGEVMRSILSWLDHRSAAADAPPQTLRSRP